ncbi:MULTISPECIES: cobaltochelatase subunit CobN [Methanobrevibacter]|uniref:Cobaltochelatase CobN n=1 Tax=Methanobrevibacter gottschalkii DSM 11977 TaxID=1122229 RepID=A0A3N5B155_9EURY|nr:MULTISPECIES: cobaltochelatase subunit CobN [Methanobrevibacter]OED01781.1 magnesium chelatase [Methanobrevibacter sp. A27]RPF50889.1 cobaltochelatase CobN [Methanobrevibacter gottschalkii DSM 11977]
MKFFRKKPRIFLILLIVMICFCLFSQLAFAENINESEVVGNAEIENNLSSTNDNFEVSKDIGYNVSKKISTDNSNENLRNSQHMTLFIISDNPGTNILDKAILELSNENKINGVNLIIRNGNQVKSMNENELSYLLSDCDAFIGEWISSDVDSVLTSVLVKNPDLSNKKLFLVLEPPSGNLNSGSSSLNLIRNNTLNYNKIFTNYSNEELINYFKNTKRGNSYSNINNYLTNGNGKNFDSIFNRLVLYKDLNDKNNLKNQILFILNYLGVDVSYEQPTFTGVKNYGIYRDRWYSLDEYISTFFKATNNRTVGILESKMYIESQQLNTCYSIINSLESRNYNVIPVFADGGSAEQLKVMVESWTSAGDDISGFLSNSSNFDVYIDAIVSMVAYGVGGENFTKATSFFEEAGVQVFRAVHSDHVSNEQWELGSTGLTTEKSDKWWHITIAEAQGIIDATFIGGNSSYISNLTGAQITTYIPHEGNIGLLADRIDSWVDLKYTLNEDKLISIIYYNYPPGKQNIGSSYLDTIKSIYNILYTLKAAGYTVGSLPVDVSELEYLMLTCGINVATWAPGELEKIANRSCITLLPVSEYNSWFNSLDEIVRIQVSNGTVAYIGELTKRAVELDYTKTIGSTIDDWYNQVVSLLPDEKSVEAKEVLSNIVRALKDYANTHSQDYYRLYLKYFDEFKELNIQGLNGWGETPGNVMVVNKNGTDYFVIPGLTFGNIFVAPEPQRGWESDIKNLYHCTAVAPTHQYLAAYYYMQTRNPNAMIFTGRHATHEWLPGKEILLSATDYGSVVVGDVPQLYFYISDGLGEAIQAKRRGFAVIISHLTSPMSYTHLYGNLTFLANLINDYQKAGSSSEKNKIGEKIQDLIISNDYSTNLGLNKSQIKSISIDSLIEKINIFLKSTQDTLHPLGLHALGEYWSEEDIASTVSAMLSHDFVLENNQGTLNLFTELSNYYYSKSYGDLTPFEREFVLNKSYDICKALIYWDVNSVSNVLINGNVKFNNSNFYACLNLAKSYINLINQSISNELNAMLDGLNGRYIPTGEGGEIVVKPSILPTGTNIFQDQSSELPTQDAWNYAKILALLTLADLNDTTEKIIMGIWCVETARDDGALVSTVLYLLGMKPVWTNSSSAGFDDEGNPTGKKVGAMPEVIKLNDLTRPEGWNKKRIDVTIITSGLFRDLYSSQSVLMDNAFRVALARSYLTLINNKTLMNGKYGKELRQALDCVMEGINYYRASNEALKDNYVAQHWIKDCLYYLSIGYNASYAGECAITRIFAPPNGDYGAGISKLVSMSWTWNNTDELAQFYLGRMGNMYSKNYWGDTNPLVFLKALSNSDTIITSRNTNQYGVMDNDDFFDYWGGLSMAVEHVSGKSPKMNVLMYADKDNAYISSLEEVMYREIASRYDNPEWIKGMMKEGYSGARYMSNKFVSNLLGWQVTRPDSVSDDLWNRVYNTYYKDKYNLGVKDWLMSGNNAYSLISMSGTMLSSIHKGYWNADDATIRDIANTWAQATVKNGVACCDCSCGNVAMMQWAVQYVNPDILAQLLPKLYDATENPVFLNNTHNPNTKPENNNDPQVEPSTPNPTDGSSSSSTISNNATSTNSNQHSLSNSQNSQGNAVSDVGDSSSSDSGTFSSEGADVKKAIEINPITQQSASEVGMSLLAVLGVICLILIVGVGYFRDNGKEKKGSNLDELFNEKL